MAVIFGYPLLAGTTDAALFLITALRYLEEGHARGKVAIALENKTV